MKEEVFADIVNEMSKLDRRIDPGTIMKDQRPGFDQRWRERSFQRSVVPGKTVFERLARWSQDKYGAGVTPLRVARCLYVSEIDHEISMVIERLQDNKPFDSTQPRSVA
jgi:hypothetical protein